LAESLGRIAIFRWLQFTCFFILAIYLPDVLKMAKLDVLSDLSVVLIMQMMSSKRRDRLLQFL